MSDFDRVQIASRSSRQSASIKRRRFIATNAGARSTPTRTVSRRRFLEQTSLGSAILAAASSFGGAALRADDQPKPAWEMTKTVSLEGLEISLSKPRLVARSRGYFWFPTMTRLSGGELFANFSTNRDAVVADRTSSVSWSADDGLTWSEPSSIMPKGDLYAEAMLRLKNGDEMLLPFNLYPDGGAMRGWHKDRSANGTSASVGRAGRITRSNSRSWLGGMRPDRGGAAELPSHAQGQICLVGSSPP